MNKRWYDKGNQGYDVFERLKELDDASLRKLSENILKIADSIKAINREQEERPVSLGIDRVKGLYKQNKNRRWYDKQKDLKNAMNSISTLSDEEYLGIIEALEVALKN